MAIGRVTQKMMSQGSLNGLQLSLGRVAKLQEQLSTGRVINRPSDSPTDTTSSMRIRASLAAQKQFVRNADDGLGWLNQADSALASAGDQVRRARELGTQGVNGVMGPAAREALATEVDQLRESLISVANTSYLDRPIFGGLTSGSKAYDASGAYVGLPGAVSRTVADGVEVDVNVDGPAVFGTGAGSLFTHLTDLAAALRSGDTVAIGEEIGNLQTDGETIANTQALVGTRTSRIERARLSAEDTGITLSTSISELENTDLAKAVVDLQMQEVAYQAALSATSRVMQPSLLDFLR